MESLPYETLFNVLLPLPYQEIITFCQINRQYINICQDSNFWATKAHLELKIPFNEFYQTKLSGPDRYLQLLAEVGGRCVPGSERSVDVNICLGLASKHNNINLVKYFLEQGANNLRFAFVEAAANGHLEILKYLVSSMTNKTVIDIEVLKKALNLAVLNQYQQIIDYLLYLSGILHYDFPSIDDLNYALIISATTGNIQIFNYLVSVGATDLNNALDKAAEYNQKNLIIHIIDLSRSINYTLDLIYALYGASTGGHKELFGYILALDPRLNNINFLNNALYKAADGGHKNMIDHIRSLGANNSNKILEGAAHGGHRELVDYALSLGATNLNEALIDAASGGHNDIILYLITLGAINLNEALLAAIDYGHFETVKYLLTQGPLLKQQYPRLILPTVDELEEEEVLSFVSQYGDIELAQYLISLGTIDLSHALFTAIKYNRIELVKYLLTNVLSFKRQNPNIILPTEEELDLALMLLARDGDLDLIKYLIEHRRELLEEEPNNINPTSDKLKLAILSARNFNHQSVVQYLSNILRLVQTQNQNV